MAKVRVSLQLIEDMVFGFTPSPVRVTDLAPDYERGEVVFEVEGVDVPDGPEVIAVCHVQQNRAGQRLVTMTFQPKN